MIVFLAGGRPAARRRAAQRKRHIWRKRRSESIRCRNPGFISRRGFRGHDRATAVSGRAAQGVAACRHIAHSITVMALPGRNSHRGVRWTLPTVVVSLPRKIFWLWKITKKKPSAAGILCLSRTWSLNFVLLNCDQRTYLPYDLGEHGRALPTAAAVVFQHPVCARAAKMFTVVCVRPGGSQLRWEVERYKYC